MKTQRLAPNVLFVVLPAEPQLRPELALIRENISRTGGLHLVLDLSHVELITSPSIGALLLTQKLLVEQGYRLILCNMCLATKCILRVAGLEAFFEYAGDRFEARDALRGRTGTADRAARGSE